MSRNETSLADESAPDAGSLLPGCSVPVRLDDDGTAVHAFRFFEAMPIDGLRQSALAGVLDSMRDVARSLDQLHQVPFSYGRITSTSFHNRGTAAAPAATLWVEPRRAAEKDTVHAGDPESMYWTAARLRDGAAATPADDWFAMGVVLAELLLSSEAVHKIWDLSRQEGNFVESLIRNLKRARCNRTYKRHAITLLQQGAAGRVPRPTVNTLIQTDRVGGVSALAWPWSAAMLAAAVLAIAVIGWSLMDHRERLAEARQSARVMETQLEKAESAASELQIRADVLRKQAALRRATAGESTGAASAGDDLFPEPDRSFENWAVKMAGRPLEEAIEQSASMEITSASAGMAAWLEVLLNLAAVPGQKQWRGSDPIFRRLVQKVVDQPWERTDVIRAVERGEALSRAYRRWEDWARGESTFEQIRAQHDLMPSGQVKDLLGEWLGQALEVTQFQLEVVRVIPGEGNEWTAHLIGYETEADSQTEKWLWDNPLGDSQKTELGVNDYRPGQSLEFWLQRDSSIPLWNSTVIKHTFKSPLLVWQLARELRLQDSKSGYVVLLTTDRRFGPPPILLDEATGKRAVLRSRPDAKKVIDPMESLPF